MRFNNTQSTKCFVDALLFVCCAMMKLLLGTGGAVSNVARQTPERDQFLGGCDESQAGTGGGRWRVWFNENRLGWVYEMWFLGRSTAGV